MASARKSLIPFPVSRDLTGRNVGRFVIGSKLGAGGMGEVYYAEDTTLRRPVALKRVSNKIGSDPGARQHILQEAQRASALSSEHIAAVHDVLEENGEIFVVMEYVPGETLREHLRYPMSLEQFFDISKQCAEALAAAHEHGIVHCDIKPENIMLSSAGQVKILDFGVAKHVPRSDQSSTLDSSLVGGTPAYMAPEVLLEKLPDIRSDIFSLGVVMYEMLTLKNPFFTSSFVATTQRILHDTPAGIRALNPAVSEELECVVMKAMAKTTGQRYTNAGELLDDLHRVEEGGLPKPPPAVTLLQESKRNFWLVATLVLLAALTLAFAVYRGTRHRLVLAERGWILISDFETSGDGAISDMGVREGLTIALQQSRYINVFPRSRAYETLQRMKRQDAPRINEALGREICQRENVRVLLTGRIEHMGQLSQISVQAVDPEQGNLLFAERERFDRKDQLFEKVDSLAKAVRADLGESLAGINKSSRPLAKVTTSSLEALQLYSQAQDAKDHGKEEQIEVLLMGALQLDPNFAMAHMQLGQYYAAVVGRNQKALTELESAYRLRQGISTREQHRIEAGFYDLQERYDEKAQALRVLVSLYPDDEEAHTELAAAYYDLGQLDKAIAEMQEALRLNPFSAPAYGGLVLYLARANHPDMAIATAREAEQRSIGSPRMHWGLGLAYLGQGNLNMARQEFQRIGRATTTNSDLRDLCLIVADLYEGRLGLARIEVAKQIQTVPPLSGGLQLFRRFLLGRIYLTNGDARQAELQADLMLQMPGSSMQGGDLVNAGILYVRAGRLTKARDVLRTVDEVQKRTPSSSNRNDFRNLEGEILLAEAKPGEAEISFSSASQAFSPFISSIGLARAYQAERRWDLAAKEWENVLAERGEILQSGFPPDFAIAHVELARVYRQVNNRDLARQHYEEALRLWRHADELDLLWDARRELRELVSEAGRPNNHQALP